MDVSSLLIPLLLTAAALWGLGRRMDVYDALTAGAAEGLTVLLRIVPSLIALLTAVYMLRVSGALALLARLLSTQLITKGEKHLLDRNRYYYKLLRRIIREGQDGGEFRTDLSVNEMVKLYAIAERALLYDWCICNGEYSLKTYGSTAMPIYLAQIRIRDI